MSKIQEELPAGGKGDAQWLDIVVRQAKSLRYGIVRIEVHDSRVVQIEKTERLRVDRSGNDPEET
jgi:hypothetical protein